MGEPMINDPLADVRALLELWGRWVRMGRPGPAQYRCTLGGLRGGGLPTLPLSDDDALAVDAAVVELTSRIRDTGRAVELYYTRPGITYDQVAKLMRVPGPRGRRLVREMILSGEHWLDARLAQVLARKLFRKSS